MSRIVEELTELCVGDDTDITAHRQRLLRNLDVHTDVFNLLKMPDSTTSSAMQLTVHKAAHLYLQRFCQANPENQLALGRHISSLIEQVLLNERFRIAYG